MRMFDNIVLKVLNTSTMVALSYIKSVQHHLNSLRSTQPRDATEAHMGLLQGSAYQVLVYCSRRGWVSCWEMQCSPWWCLQPCHSELCFNNHRPQCFWCTTLWVWDHSTTVLPTWWLWSHGPYYWTKMPLTHDPVIMTMWWLWCKPVIVSLDLFMDLGSFIIKTVLISSTEVATYSLL